MSLNVAVEDYQKYSKRLAEYSEALLVQSRKMHPEKLGELAERRRMSIETLEEAGVFYIGDMREMVHPLFVDEIANFGVVSETNGKPIFDDRYVFPIKDSYGNVINFVGYTWKADVRYVYGTGRYYERTNDFYGAENMPLIYKMGWGVVVEGITDCVALRNAGVKNSLATCGTIESAIRIDKLARVEHGIIFIHDRDKAGDNTREHWVVPRCVRLNISNGCKDIDEYLDKVESDEEQEERRKSFIDCLDICVAWLMGGTAIRNGSKPIETSATLF